MESCQETSMTSGEGNGGSETDGAFLFWLFLSWTSQSGKASKSVWATWMSSASYFQIIPNNDIDFVLILEGLGVVITPYPIL